ncbi:MAG: PQQ-binding-like beta-propeller repeat protein [Ilumatobacteraceae bacterium]
MSDESHPPLDDHLPPTDEGYGFYEVEQYSGDPLLRAPRIEPDELLADIESQRPLFDRAGPDRDPIDDAFPLVRSTGAEPDFDPTAFDPPRVVRQVRRPQAAAAVPFAPPDPDDQFVERDGSDAGYLDGDEQYSDEQYSDDREPMPAIARAGRVSFAERNWRIPTIITLVAALIVIGTVILLLPDDGIINQDSAELIELRRQPSKLWDEDLNGFASGTASDSDTLYAVVAKRSTVEVVAIDLADGDAKWRTKLGVGTVASTGDLSLGENGLTVVIDSGTSSGVLATIAVDTGKIGWQVAFDGSNASILTDSLVAVTDSAGDVMINAIDRKAKKMGISTAADAYAIEGDVIYVDAGNVLTKRSATTLEPEVGFRYNHTAALSMIALVGTSPVVAVGEQIIRLDVSGDQRYTFAPDVGIIRSLLPMQGDAVLVGGSGRMRAVAISEDSAEPITGVRTGVTPVAIVEVEDGELIVASIASGSSGSGAAATLRVSRIVDDGFEPVDEIDLTGAEAVPTVVFVGSTVYATSYETVARFIAADLDEGTRLWSIPLIDTGDVAMIGRTGVLLFTRQDDETIVTFFAPAD